MRRVFALFFCFITVGLISCSSDLHKQEIDGEIVKNDQAAPIPIVDEWEAKKERLRKEWKAERELRLQKRREVVQKYCRFEEDDEDVRKRVSIGCVPLGFRIVTDNHPRELLSLGMNEKDVEEILSENGFSLLSSTYQSASFNGPGCGDSGVMRRTYIRAEKMNTANVFRVFHARDGEVQVKEKCLNGLMSRNSFYLYEHEDVSEKRINFDKFHLTVDETPESIKNKLYSFGWSQSWDGEPQCWGDMKKHIGDGKDFFPIDFEKNASKNPTVKLSVRAKFVLNCEDKENPKVVGFDDLEVRL